MPEETAGQVSVADEKCGRIVSDAAKLKSRSREYYLTDGDFLVVSSLVQGKSRCRQVRIEMPVSKEKESTTAQ